MKDIVPSSVAPLFCYVTDCGSIYTEQDENGEIYTKHIFETQKMAREYLHTIENDAICKNLLRIKKAPLNRLLYKPPGMESRLKVVVHTMDNREISCVDVLTEVLRQRAETGEPLYCLEDQTTKRYFPALPAQIELHNQRWLEVYTSRKAAGYASQAAMRSFRWHLVVTPVPLTELYELMHGPYQGLYLYGDAGDLENHSDAGRVILELQPLIGGNIM